MPMPEINIDQIQSKITNNPFDQNRGIDINSVTTPELLYSKVVYVLIFAVGIVAVLVLLWSGFSYITAGGDAEKAEKAKKMIVGTIIGILIILGSYVIYNSVVDTVNGRNPLTKAPTQIVREA